MATIHDFRRENLIRLLKDFPSIADFNERLGRDRNNPTFTMIKNQSGLTNGRTRVMGDSLAREIEKKLELQEGWMDVPHEPAAKIRYFERDSDAPSKAIFQMKSLRLAGGENTEEALMYLDPMFFQIYFPGRQPDEFALSVVSGTSMEPTLSPSDRVLIDMSTGSRFTRDGVYLVCYSKGNDKQKILRRIRMKLDGTLMISADKRPDEEQNIQEIEGLELHGRVAFRWKGEPI